MSGKKHSDKDSMETATLKTIGSVSYWKIRKQKHITENEENENYFKRSLLGHPNTCHCKLDDYTATTPFISKAVKPKIAVHFFTGFRQTLKKTNFFLVYYYFKKSQSFINAD